MIGGEENSKLTPMIDNLNILPFGSVSAATQRLRLLSKKYPEFELMRGHDVRRFRSQQLARPENIEAAR